MTYDCALAKDEQGRIVVHEADCPVVRAQAERGEPVVTLFACQWPLPDKYERHVCWTGGDK